MIKSKHGRREEGRRGNKPERVTSLVTTTNYRRQRQFEREELEQNGYD
jgi:hypothetical protein